MTPKHRSVLRRKSNGKVFKKRRFYGNRNQNELDPDGEDTDNPATPPSTSADLTSTFTSTSSKKLLHHQMKRHVIHQPSHCYLAVTALPILPQVHLPCQKTTLLRVTCQQPPVILS